MDFDLELNNIFNLNKHQFYRFSKQLNAAEKQSTYFYLLQVLVRTIEENDFNRFKQVTKSIAAFTKIQDKNNLREWFLDAKNPLLTSNLILLCCKQNRNDFLNFLFVENNEVCLKNLSIDVNKNAPLPSDVDDEQHNAIYYAIRNGNIEMVKIIVENWPKKLLSTTQDCSDEEMDRVVSETYYELIMKNVVLSDEIKMFVTNKLFDYRFKCVQLEKGHTHENSTNNLGAKNQLKLRIDLVLENIDTILTEYSNGKEFDDNLLFLCRSLAKDIHILKEKVKFSYSTIPWEEMEFIIVAFVLSQTKRDEVNLFYLLTLRHKKFFKHLKYFGDKLKSKRKELMWNKKNKFPFGYRHSYVDDLIQTDTEYCDLLDDFEVMRDAYSFKKILDAIDIALIVNPTDDNASIILVRTLQIIGEFVKNTWESPNLSPNPAELLITAIPTSVQAIMTSLRNSIKNAEGINKLSKMIADGNDFIKTVQNDLMDMQKLIVVHVYRNLCQLVLDVLVEVSKAKDMELILEISRLVDWRNFDDQKFVNDVQKTRNNFDLIEIIKDFETLAKLNKDNEPRLKEINKIATEAQNKIWTTKNGYYLAKLVAKCLQTLIFEIEYFGLKHINETALTGVEELKTAMKNESVYKILELMNKCLKSSNKQLNESVDKKYSPGTRTYLPDLNKMRHLACKISLFSGVKLGRAEIIEELTYELSLNQLEGDQVVKTDLSALPKRFDDLKKILKMREMYMEQKNARSSKKDKCLVNALEVISLDILSMIIESSDRFSTHAKPNYLDMASPLLSGRNLRNYLAHKNPLFDILQIDTTIQLVCHAQHLLNAYEQGKLDGDSRIFIGEKNIEDISKVKDLYFWTDKVITTQKLCFEAFESGDFSDVKNCLRNGAELKARDSRLFTALHYAAKNKNLENANVLLLQKLDPNSKDVDGFTPFYISIKHGNVKLTEHFLEKCEIKLFESLQKKLSAFQLAVDSSSTDMIKLLLKYNNIICFESVVFYAVQQRESEISKILFEHKRIFGVNHARFSFLTLAAIKGMVDLVEYLIENGADVNQTNNQGGTALQLAAFHGHYEIVKLLLSKGANPNIKSVFDQTPLLMACIEGHEKVVKVLLRHGADPTIDNQTPIFVSCAGGWPSVVKILLENGNVNVNVEGSDSLYPIHYASMNDNLDTVKLLIENGAIINTKTLEDITPLHLAAYNGCFSIVKVIKLFK